VVLRSDSRLLVQQLLGRFKVKNQVLQRLHREAESVLIGFERARIEHVARERNREADRLANQGVDEWLAGRGGDVSN
jgi:ribonuclease HI